MPDGGCEDNMLFQIRRKKFIYAAVFTLLLILCCGCGSRGEKTQGAMELIKSFEYQQALDELDSAEEDGENIRFINRARGIACMGLTEYASAIEYFRAALEGSNGLVQDMDFDINYYLAAAYTKDGQYDLAESTYNAILALRGGEVDAYFLRGNVRMNKSDFDAAKQDFDKAVSMAPDDYDMLIEIYEVLEHFGYVEAGQEYLRTALDAGGKKMDNYIAGRIYYYLGEYEKAYLALEEAKEKGGEKSYLYLGRAYEATGDYNYAANVYNSYLSANQGSAEMYNQLGLCEMARGDWQKALEAFQAGMQLEDNPILQTLSFNEIAAYEYLGEYERAAALLNNYLKNYPDDEKAKREYEFLSTR